MTLRETIRKTALEILKEYPEGIRYSELVRKIHEKLPNVNINTIQGNIYNLDSIYPDKIYKPSRGVFRLIEYKDENYDKEIESLEKETEISADKKKEEDFYQAFADYLVNELEECTKAIPLGGNIFRDKWGTPDVIGIKEPKRSDIIQFNTEIISAEIKIDSNALITAFGQACAYKLFSHKSYIDIPKNSSEEDISRLDSLCLIFGIGLVLFNPNDPTDPQFEIRVRPLKHEPDMFYVNKYLKFIEDQLFC